MINCLHFIVNKDREDNFIHRVQPTQKNPAECFHVRRVPFASTLSSSADPIQRGMSCYQWAHGHGYRTTNWPKIQKCRPIRDLKLIKSGRLVINKKSSPNASCSYRFLDHVSNEIINYFGAKIIIICRPSIFGICSIFVTSANCSLTRLRTSIPIS